MMRKTGILGVILLLVLGLVSAAWGRLAAVGPINPASGFPLYYEDTNGVAVWLPPPLPWAPPLPAPPPAPYAGGPWGLAVGKGGVATPPSMIFFPADPLINPFAAQIGFDQEFFYWSCQDAGKVTTAFGKFTFQLSLEASFSNLPPSATNGFQTVFSRLRCKGTTLPAGTYTLTHPYGVQTLNASAGSGINFTRDTPLTAPLNFTTVLGSGDTGPFLRQLNPPPVITAGTPPPFDTGWLGDGVTACTITGSPTGFNQVRLDGPPGSGIGGPGVDFIIITQFIVSGHQYPVPLPTPVTLNRVTYTRTHFTTYFDVFANSVAGGTLNSRIGTPTPIPMAAGLNQFAGLFYVRANYLNNATRGYRGSPFNPSAPVSVTAQVGTDLPTIISQTASDQVTITQAIWSAATQVLTVAARSSDSALRSPLNVVNPALGALLGAGTFPCPIPPATISVASPAGGVATKAVQIVP